MDKYMPYCNQFTPADIQDAKDLVRYCMEVGIAIDLENYGDDFVADLLIVKCMELAKYASK